MRAARGRFKGPDPAEWPRSILGADRMPGQDDSVGRSGNETITRADRTRPDDLLGVTNRVKGEKEGAWE